MKRNPHATPASIIPKMSAAKYINKILIQIGHFTITSNEIGDYGSLDKAIIAYMHRDYPDNNPADEERYSMIRKQEKQLQSVQKALLIDILKQNGGRVTSYPVPDEDGGTDEHGEPCVDGIDEEIGSVERGFQVYPEQISWVLDFLTVALGFKETEEEQ